MESRFDSNFGHVAQVLTDGAMDGLVAAAEFLLTESNVVVPIDEGTLERSGAVSHDRVAGEVAVSYDTPYAARQHEELTWQHAPGRKAKYLEETALEHRETMARIVQIQTERRMREG